MQLYSERGDKWCKHQQKGVAGHEMLKIVWNMTIQRDYSEPDIVLENEIKEVTITDEITHAERKSG